MPALGPSLPPSMRMKGGQGAEEEENEEEREGEMREGGRSEGGREGGGAEEAILECCRYICAEGGREGGREGEMKGGRERRFLKRT